MEIIVYVASSGICMIFLYLAFILVKFAKEKCDLEIRCESLERSQKSKCRTQAHADQWNKDDTLSMQQEWDDGKETLSAQTLALFSMKEIEFIEQLVKFIRRASLNQQKENSFVAKFLGNRLTPDPSAN